MIDPHWILEDLDPHTWRAIGRFFMPGQYIAAARPDEHGLFILHDGGRRPRIVDSTSGPRSDLGLDRIDDPRGVAHDLHARGEWDRVHVIDKRHLAHVAAEAQASPQRELTLDAYYHIVFQLIWDGSDGYVAVPPHPGHWNGWTYSDIRAMLSALPTPSALGLCVVDEIGLAVRVESGRVTRVTTLEGLPPLPTPAVDNAFFEAFWSALESPAAALVCTPEVFERWIMSADKPAVLREATHKGTARLRVASDGKEVQEDQ
jgi:hypothetical protein